MQIKEYLTKYQPVIYKTFENALSNDVLSHAYLLIGEPGTPLLNVTKYLAKSILCDHGDPFACENCVTCKRIDDGNYPDFVIYDGSKSTIKKQEIDNLEEEFDKKAFEKKGIKIYILNLVENMTVQAVNAILKFLEEPGKQIYAFLTTNNESLILPTIVSRCQVMHLKLVDRKTIIKESIDAGVEPLDAQLLSYVYNDVNMLLEAADKKNTDYKGARDAIITFLDDLVESSNKAIYDMQRNTAKLISGKESANFFLALLISCLQDIQAIRLQKSPYLLEKEETLRKISEKILNIDVVFKEVLKAKGQLALNLNIPLLLDHIAQIIINNCAE